MRMAAISAKNIREGLDGFVHGLANLNRSLIYRRKVRANLGLLGVSDRGAASEYCSSPWKTMYEHFSGIVSDEYISEEYFYCHVEPLINPENRIQFYLDKNNFDKLNIGLKLPATLGRIVRGRFLDRDYRPADPRDALDGHREVVVKPALDRSSGAGKGVRFLPTADAVAFARTASSCAPGEEYVFQAPLTQSPTLARLNPSSVNTLRILTYGGPSAPSVLSAFLRIGRMSSRIDDCGAGGFECSVRDGRLAARAYDDFFAPYEAHPDTSVRFEDYALPGWTAACDLVTAIHARLPEIALISWDIAFDADERPITIELNTHRQDIISHQMFHGPLFGAFYDDMRARLTRRPRTAFGLVLG